MGSRYLSKTALFAPKTVSPRCHRFVTALFWGRKVRKSLEKRSRKSDLAPGQSRSGPSLQREVEVLVNFAEGAQTVSSCAGVRLRICRFSLFEKLLKSLLRYVGKKQTYPVGAGLVRAWCGPGAGLVRPWQSCCGRRIASLNPVVGAGLLHSILLRDWSFNPVVSPGLLYSILSATAGLP